MGPAVLVAIAASIGNLLQGWDYGTIAGALLYIKKEFKLQSEPTIEGLIVAMQLIGATIITTFSGAVSDAVGRRPMLIVSSLLYFISGLLMLWSPNVYILLLARLIDGFGIGLSVTLVPIYISETAPSEIRGSLNTLPQFIGSGGTLFSYCMVFGMSLMTSPSWRIMLGVLSIPSMFYFILTVFYLPESPRWLVSKGRMAEAKQVLQNLRGREDVSGEMALLTEALAVGPDTLVVNDITGPANEYTDNDVPERERLTLYGPELDLSWVGQPVNGGQSALSVASSHGSMHLLDPVVTLFGSVHEKLPETMGSLCSALFPNFGNMFSVVDRADQQGQKTEQWDEESLCHEGEGEEGHASDVAGSDFEENLQSPLLSCQTSEVECGEGCPNCSLMRMWNNSLMGGVVVSNIGIGSGWQLAWKWSEKEGPDSKKDCCFKRIYLFQEGIQELLPNGAEEVEFVHVAAPVSQPALFSKELVDQHLVGSAMVHPSETNVRGSLWKNLSEPGVRRALLVGVGIRILQQFVGISGVYIPQILEQTGVKVILANIGISSDSASILISAVTTLLMLTSVGIAMRLMDISGRRFLLLATIPILIVSSTVLVLCNLIDLGTIAHAVLSTISIIVYFCTFVMGIGPVPSVLCAEIFPTRVRGICIAICTLTFWIGDIIVTYSLPLLLDMIGLAGVFGICTVVCVLAFAFVFFKVPETKGMPLEVITEFFALGAEAEMS